MVVAVILQRYRRNVVLRNRLDLVKYAEDDSGLIIGFVERVSGEIVYHVGVISIDGLQAKDANAIATVVIDCKTEEEEIFPRVSSMATAIGVGITDEELSYCLDRLGSSETNY